MHYRISIRLVRARFDLDGSGLKNKSYYLLEETTAHGIIFFVR
jgi:hypothetical protein